MIVQKLTFPFRMRIDLKRVSGIREGKDATRNSQSCLAATEFVGTSMPAVTGERKNTPVGSSCRSLGCCCSCFLRDIAPGNSQPIHSKPKKGRSIARANHRHWLASWGRHRAAEVNALPHPHGHAQPRRRRRRVGAIPANNRGALPKGYWGRAMSR